MAEVGPAARAAAAPVAVPTVVGIGQIRLLRPATLIGPDDRPVYVAVIEERAGNSFLVAPFGRFSTPADPGEWQTGLKAPPLRVLCLWNSRVAAGETLARNSWPAGRLAPRKVAEALEVYRLAKLGVPPTTVRPSRLGPPLRHPLDPRLQYRAEEAALIEECLRPAEAREPADGAGRVYEMRERSELPLAAEAHPDYGSAAKGKRRRSGRNGQPDDPSTR